MVDSATQVNARGFAVYTSEYSLPQTFVEIPLYFLRWPVDFVRRLLPVGRPPVSRKMIRLQV